MATLHDVTAEAVPKAAESLTLEQKKLALEIRQLASPSWLTPATLAPIATILLGLFGFLWAAANGVFDVARRELDVRKREVEMDTRELTQQRDKQSRAFAIEASKQRAEILQLHLRVASSERQLDTLKAESVQAQARLIQLDRAIITRWSATGGPDNATIGLNGVNFGETPGQIDCRPATRTSCVPTPDGKSMICSGDFYVTEDLCTVVTWSSDTVVAHVNLTGFPEVMRGLDKLEVSFKRADGKPSTIQTVDVPRSWTSGHAKN